LPICFDAFLLGLPRAGSRLMLLLVGSEQWLVTGEVLRVMGCETRNVLYVETTRSLYELVLYPGGWS